MGNEHAALEDEKLADSEPSAVAVTEVDSQHCEVKDSNKSEETNTSAANEQTRADFSNNMSLDMERGEESNAKDVSTADPPGRVMMRDSFCDYNERILAGNYYLAGYPTPILNNDLHKRQLYHEVIDEKQFPYDAFLGFGLANFMSYAAHFCKYEARDEAEIISIGSGDGTLDREIIFKYRKHFGEEIKITLVDPNPDYEVDFKTVDDLLEARPEAVGNCILLIIWPEPMGRNDGYDIDAVRKLQPLAALVLYEPTQVSGSAELTGFLRRKTKETVRPGGYECDEYGVGLENYAVEKVIRQQVYLEAGREVKIFDIRFTREPAMRHLCLVLVKFEKLYKK